jgi:acetyl esterase
MDIEAVRRAGDETARAVRPLPPIATVQDIEAAGRAARLYRPSPDRTPLVVYLHGGGWTIGSVATYDHFARRLASRSGAAVLLLEYRLAPEHPWPASIDDTVAALRWVANRPEALGPVESVAVAGDSAGGTLATLACLVLRDASPAALPALQVLAYPNTDLTGSQPSMREKATGYGLTADGVRFFSRQWVPDQAMWSDPRVSPLYAPDLSGLPRALVVTAEHDPLRDEGERYAERLRDAGVEVTLRREHGLLHNFMRMDDVSPASAAAGDRVADDIRRLLASAP